MTTGLNYATYKNQIASMAVVEETNDAYNTILPMLIPPVLTAPAF